MKFVVVLFALVGLPAVAIAAAHEENPLTVGNW